MSRIVKETLGTCIQLLLFVCLIPALVFFFREFLGEAGVMDRFSGYLINVIPGAQSIDFLIKSLTHSTSFENLVILMNSMLQSMSDEFVGIMYVAMWMHAFRVIFKELLRIPGLPIWQTILGLLFGAMTLSMLNELIMAIMATLFLMVLNVVLIIITFKNPIKKFLDICFDMSLEALNVILTGCYLLLVCMLGTGATPESITPVFITIVGTWVCMNVIRYLLVMRIW